MPPNINSLLNLQYIVFACKKDIDSFCKGSDREFPFPIIADPDRSLAVSLDMIDEEQMSDPDIAQTIRAMFIIDPSHRLRLSMLYPMSTGRSIRWVLNHFLRKHTS